MSSGAAKRGHLVSHRYLSSFLCYGGGAAEHPGTPSKPVHQLEQVPEQQGKSLGLPVQCRLPQKSDISGLEESSSCSFLERLPFELRLRIYEYALGGQTIHLVHLRNDSVQWPFQASSPMITSMIGANWDPLKPDPWEPPIISLALLLTCRQIYSEAADVLYSSNFFATDNIRVFIHLAENCRCPQRLLAIKHLQVSITWRFFPLLASYTGQKGDYNGYYDSATWRRFWHLVANDMRLTSLGIDVDSFGAEENLSVDAEWVKPILQVKGIRYPKVAIRPAGRSFEMFREQAESFQQELLIAMGRKRDEI